MFFLTSKGLKLVLDKIMLQKFRLLFTILTLTYSTFINASDIKTLNEQTFKRPQGVIVVSSQNKLNEDFKSLIGNCTDWDFTNKDIQKAFTVCVQGSPGLTEIYLSNCKLHILPIELYKLSMLNILDLSHNDFSTGLVETNPLQALYLLTQLKKLYLNSCRINVLPDSFRQLSNLSLVELKDNKLEMPEHLIRTYFPQNTNVIVGGQSPHPLTQGQPLNSKMRVAYLIAALQHSQVE